MCVATAGAGNFTRMKPTHLKCRHRVPIGPHILGLLQGVSLGLDVGDAGDPLHSGQELSLSEGRLGSGEVLCPALLWR